MFSLKKETKELDLPDDIKWHLEMARYADTTEEAEAHLKVVQEYEKIQGMRLDRKMSKANLGVKIAGGVFSSLALVGTTVACMLFETEYNFTRKGIPNAAKEVGRAIKSQFRD